MSSPITFSGFNEIDFNLVLNSIMQQASQPLVALQTRQAALQSQITTFDTLASRIAALRSAADDLGDPDAVRTLAGTSSDATAVGVSVGSDATAGHYEVVVNELARAQVMASSSTAPDATTTVIASGGSITIGGVTVTLSGDVTLQQLAEAINGTDGIGVTAAVVRTSPGAYRLALSSTLSGTEHAFTVTNALTGGAGVAFTDTDGNNISGDSPADNAVNASDASLLVNNIPVTGSSNVFADVMPGVTLTVLKKDPAATVQVDVASDGAALKEKVEKFVTAYNDVVKFLNEQRLASGRGEASSIGREPLLRQLRNSLRTELLGPHGAETITRLSEVGVEFTTAGTLEIDDAVFSNAVEAHGDQLREMFASAGGVFPAIEAVLDGFAEADGFIASVKERLNHQIDSMDTQIAAMQSRLALQRATLQREFIAADEAMARLRGQSSSLASIGGAFGTF